MKIRASSNHTVLFQLPISHNKEDDLESFVASKTDAWDGNHVRMPNSSNSKYEEINENGVSEKKSRWDLIESSLLMDYDNSYQLEEAIKKYNSSYEKLWNFSSLHYLVQEEMDTKEKHDFLSKLLPQIISFALRLNDFIKCPIPLLKQGMNHSISMTQEQGACLLANAFLCTFPRRNTEKRNSEFASYPDINFSRLFGCDGQKNREKLKCILNYFQRVLQKKSSLKRSVITFQRRSINEGVLPIWSEDERKVSSVKYHISSSGKIETASGCLQVDFANRFVGGGVLGSGSVQEEIRFVINPELIIGKLFTECLADGEALIISGTEQFSSYRGYATSFQFAGDFVDATPQDDCNRRKCRIVAIDALCYKNYHEQFREYNLVREINKAYVGFTKNYDCDKSPVATGLWGAGAFQGHPIRSALIQLMACVATTRSLIFYTFGDQIIETQIADIFQFLSLNDVSVKELLKILHDFRKSENISDTDKLIPFIKKGVISRDKPTTSTSSSGDRFKQQSILKFTSETKLKSAVSETKPNDSSKFKFRYAQSLSDDRNDFTRKSVNIFNENPAKIDVVETKPATPRRSLLDSLEDDFKK